MAIKDGTLVYYKSKSETDFGCRGAISLSKAVITKHELDEMRFDCSVGDCVWYLRASSVEEREKWTSCLESYKRVEVPHTKLRRQGSAMSLSNSSNTVSRPRTPRARPSPSKPPLRVCWRPYSTAQ